MEAPCNMWQGPAPMGDERGDAPVVFAPETALETLIEEVRGGRMLIGALEGYAHAQRARIAELEERRKKDAVEMSETIGRNFKMERTIAELEERCADLKKRNENQLAIIRSIRIMDGVVYMSPPDRIRELAIAWLTSKMEHRNGVFLDLNAEVERVLHEGAVARDMNLYDEATDGTMSANPPPKKEK